MTTHDDERGGDVIAEWEMAIVVDDLPEFEPTIRPAHWPTLPPSDAGETGGRG